MTNMFFVTLIKHTSFSNLFATAQITPLGKLRNIDTWMVLPEFERILQAFFLGEWGIGICYNDS